MEYGCYKIQTLHLYFHNDRLEDRETEDEVELLQRTLTQSDEMPPGLFDPVFDSDMNSMFSSKSGDCEALRTKLIMNKLRELYSKVSSDDLIDQQNEEVCI